MERTTYIIKNSKIGDECFKFIRLHGKDAWKEGKYIQVTVEPEKRTNPQNNLLWKIHAQWCAYLSEQTGVKVDPSYWHYKRFTPMFCEQIGEIETTDLNGEVINEPVYRTTSKCDKTEMRFILDKYIAYCITRGCEMDIDEEIS